MLDKKQERRKWILTHQAIFVGFEGETNVPVVQDVLDVEPGYDAMISSNGRDDASLK